VDCVRDGFGRRRLLPTSSSKSALSPTVFYVFFGEIELSLQSRSPFANLIVQKLYSFWRFLNEIELSLQSRAPFADLVSKVVRTHQNFLTFSSGNRALPTLMCAFCRQLQPRKQRPSFGDCGSHLTGKNAGSAPGSVFKP
jgi:hypothetical protein